MRENVKTSLKTGVAILTVSGLAMGGVALAQTADDTTPAEGTTEGTDFGRQGFRGRHGGHGFVQVLADQTGLSVAEVIEQIEAGSTIAEIADANGSSRRAVIDAMVASVTEHLEQAVADERLTQAEADERLAGATERIEGLVDSEDPLPARRGPRMRGPRGSFGVPGAQHEAIAEVLGLTVDELTTARQDGQSLGDIAAAEGVAIDDLVAVMVAPLTEWLDTAVADERLTQEEADEKLADATVRITEGIESGDGFGPRADGFGRRGHRGGPGHGPGGGRGFGPGGGPGLGAGGPAVDVVNA